MDGINLNNLPEVGVQRVVKLPVKKFIPNGNLVALYAYPSKPMDSGLILPNGGAINQSPVAIVIAAGKDCKWVKEGDTVIVGHLNVNPALVFHQKSEYWILTETQITGVVLPEFAPDKSDLPREEVPG